MYNNVEFFVIHANDVDRACAFYSNVFGWRFEPWGPPDFFLISTGTKEHPGIRGAIEKRQQPLTGTGVYGFECTISVADVDATTALVEANGGTILMRKAVIPTVGALIKFHDTEGNLVCAMRYDHH